MPTPPMSSKPALARRQTLTKNSMDDTYESGDVIGTGSFGIIRKVTRKADGIVLACKELNYGRMDERDLRQLTEEVNILEQLGSNDNIVRYHERFVDKPNNMLYILMEYCEGGDLAGVIQRCRNSGTLLSEDVVWAYLSQITLALFDCHSEVDVRGGRKAVILHRDIKPENVFLDKDNNLKLGDFGLSKAMAQAAMTQTYVGTPYYMSPELINGQPYDVKSDIWALGCLIYELCAGHPPFHEARTQPELAIMIREGKIPDLPKAYTAHLGQVVKAMLKQNPKHRPTTTQIKALDNVKLQIRAIELRRATKDLRIRDAQIILRETDLLSREAAVLLRERAVSAREENVRVGTESLKEAHANLRAERWRPSTSEEEENRPPVAAVPTEVRVASRRPLEDRRTSQIPQPFQRLPSMGSLMSLCGDTPGRSIPPTSARRKLASKSMYDLSALSTTLSTPSRPSIPFPSSRHIVESPMNVEDQYGSTSESAVSTPSKPLRLSRAPPTNALRRAISTTNIISSGYSLPPTPISQTYVDDLPSPFLKKQPSSSAVGVPVRGTRMSMGGRPSMSSRLLATRASAQKGFEEVGRRIGEKIGT